MSNKVKTYIDGVLVVPCSHKGKTLVLVKTAKQLELEEKIRVILMNAFTEIMKHEFIRSLKTDYAIQAEAGLSNGALAAIRKNKRPSYPTIVKLCYICGVPAHTLLKGL